MAGQMPLGRVATSVDIADFLGCLTSDVELVAHHYFRILARDLRDDVISDDHPEWMLQEMISPRQLMNLVSWGLSREMFGPNGRLKREYHHVIWRDFDLEGL